MSAEVRLESVAIKSDPHPTSEAMVSVRMPESKCNIAGTSLKPRKSDDKIPPVEGSSKSRSRCISKAGIEKNRGDQRRARVKAIKLISPAANEPARNL